MKGLSKQVLSFYYLNKFRLRINHKFYFPFVRSSLQLAQTASGHSQYNNYLNTNTVSLLDGCVQIFHGIEMTELKSDV